MWSKTVRSLSESVGSNEKRQHKKKKPDLKRDAAWKRAESTEKDRDGRENQPLIMRVLVVRIHRAGCTGLRDSF